MIRYNYAGNESVESALQGMKDVAIEKDDHVLAIVDGVPIAVGPTTVVDVVASYIKETLDIKDMYRKAYEVVNSPCVEQKIVVEAAERAKRREARS